ncbi:MAG: dienelactone hydrolase family protein [Pyrinomonadaceae bacterium]
MGEMVQFTSNGGHTSGYLAIPESRRGPAVVVIQEWWGLVDHIKDVCDRFAAEGFVALAPDLFHGKSAKSPDEAGKLMMALRIDEAEKDLSGAIDYLKNHDATSSEKVGTIGFCMGGALSLYAASKNSQVGACIIFYGGHPKVKPDLPNLQAPVLGIYGQRDKSVSPEVVQQLEQQMVELGKSFEVHIYPNADHAFFNGDRPEVYNQNAAEDAWRRSIEFLRMHLELQTGR